MIDNIINAVPIVIRSCTGLGCLGRGHVVVAWRGQDKLGEYADLQVAAKHFGGQVIDNTNSDTLCDACSAKLRTP